jgi:hypothetical protein
VQPEEIDFVMCTHLHVDHVGWNTRLENGNWVPTFPNAKYVMSRTDHDHWSALAKKSDTEVYQVNTYNDSVLPIVEAGKAEFVSGLHAMCGCLTLKPAPGHTPGQIRVDLDSRGKRAIFARRRAAQPGAGAALEVEQRLLRGPRTRPSVAPYVAGRLRGAGGAADAGPFRLAARGLYQGQRRPLRTRLGPR